MFRFVLYTVRIGHEVRPEYRTERFFSGFAEVVSVVSFGESFPEEHWTPFDCKEGVRGHFSHFV